jgi:hypothetical protein
MKLFSEQYLLFVSFCEPNLTGYYLQALMRVPLHMLSLLCDLNCNVRMLSIEFILFYTTTLCVPSFEYLANRIYFVLYDNIMCSIV